MAARLRKRLPLSSLAGRARDYQCPKVSLTGDDGLETVGAIWAAPGSRCYSSRRVIGSAGSLGKTSGLSSSLFGFCNFNLVNVELQRTAAAAGKAQSVGVIHTVRHKHSDEWLVERALADRRRRQARQRVRPSPFVDINVDEITPDIGPEGDNILPVIPEERGSALQPSRSIPKSFGHGKKSKPVCYFENGTHENLKDFSCIGRPDLIVTRNVEWANLAFGFEQQNKYVIMDPREPEAPVGYILEDSNVLMRQLLRRRRPFVAHVLDGFGNEVCCVRRPFWFINSTIFVEVNGRVIGEAHRRWHLWKRIYDCYLGDQQFAAVENPGFWYWTFTLHDENQGVLAVIDRNWRGFGYEFLTDAGQYVVRFGNSIPSYVPQPAKEYVRVDGRPILAGSPTGVNEMQNLRIAAQEDWFHTPPVFGGSEAADNVAPTVTDDPQESIARDSTEDTESKDSSPDDGDLLIDPYDVQSNDVDTDSW